MCGIAGILGTPDKVLMTRMLAMMRHRGPDDIGIMVDDGVALGHDRLSIIDVKKGHQPIANEDDSKFIVVNGEIYNFQALRRGLKGHILRSDSDSEVALHLYEEVGPEAVKLLDGMFALAIYDGKGLFIARDPLGIKPLYYGVANGSFYFASEIKAILEAVEVVHEFPPGCSCYIRKGSSELAPKEFASIDSHLSKSTRFDIAAKTVFAGLSDAVHKRLVSDVPLGAFLSGGIDSTIVTSLATRELKKMNTFATGMEGAPDLEMARMAADQFGVDHHELVFTEEDVINHIEWVIYHLESFDAPLVRSAIPTYFVSNLAKRYVKVVLTGEGADELFAGYQYVKNIDYPDIHDELVRTVKSLHNINLQRCDRMTMAHAVEGRVPFLDFSFVNRSLPLPTEFKLRKQGMLEKHIIREAFKSVLPKQTVVRKKRKFAEGTGSYAIVSKIAESAISDKEFERAKSKVPVNVRTKEELYCYRIFNEFFDNSSVANVVGRTLTY
jgi:asparagine synthase (glutamine-hydrolysing)